jgi:Tfp pilus assembly protein PilV
VSRVAAQRFNASTLQRSNVTDSNSHRLPAINQSSGFALVVSLIMVALMAVIAIGVLTSVSLERRTATSYNSRYQADLAVQNGLQAAAKTLAASPNGTNPVTGKDTFLVVRADCTDCTADANGNKPAYYYLAQPAASPSADITYYPLFSTGLSPQVRAIDRTARFAPTVPLPPAPTPGAASEAVLKAPDGTIIKRFPALYSWQQPTSTAGPSVDWVEMRDPQDPQGSYTRYAYWVEDLDGYLDASQVGGLARTNGTSPGEIAMFTVFDPAAQTDPGNTAATTLINNRPLLLTVPTVQQVANTSPDVAGPNLAVRLGEDNNPGEQNLVPLGYAYGTEGQTKYPINPVSQFGPNGNQVGRFASTIASALPNFSDRDVSNQPGGRGHSGHTRNYMNNLTADLLNYAFPLDAPTAFMPPGNPTAPPSSRGIGAYPFVVSIYDLNNWVATVPSGTSNLVAIETTTYVQVWNPHNFPTDGINGALTIHYQNSDQVNVNGTNQTLSSPPDATVLFTANPTSDTRTPAIISPLFETGNVGQAFNYQIKAANGYQDPKGKIKPNEYRVVVMPAPTPSCFAEGRNTYTATGLPPGLSLRRNGAKAGLINGTPTVDPNRTYANGYEDYSVVITETTSCGTTPNTPMTIRIYR